MEKKYVIFETGIGCATALCSVIAASVGLVWLLFRLPGALWATVSISVFMLIVWLADAVDRRASSRRPPSA